MILVQGRLLLHFFILVWEAAMVNAKLQQEKKMKKVPELLCPAGSWEALRAAVQNGADAVYMGADAFSARAGAKNFSVDEFVQAVDYCHTRGVHVHAALNTLIKEKELQEALHLAEQLFFAGADAIIVADLGLARAMKARFDWLSGPALPNGSRCALHASTQINVHNARTAKYLRACGFTRIVAAREIDAAALSRMKEESGAEIEVFVHGAICQSCSGQCLLSSLIGGRSGNRGRCAQPCRLPYTLLDAAGKTVGARGRYLLSPKDMCLIEHLAALQQIGADALKIEGRLKKPQYVGTVTRIYKTCLCQMRLPSKEELQALADAFSRGGFSDGYFTERMGSAMMNYACPSNTAAEHFPNDIERTYAPDANFRRTGVYAHAEIHGGQPCRLTLSDAPLNSVKQIHAAQSETEADRSKEKAELVAHKSAIGPVYTAMPAAEAVSPASAAPEGSDACHSVTVTGDAAVASEGGILSEKRAIEQLSRLGDTPFYLESLTVKLDDGVFLPVRELNRLRREACRQLAELRGSSLARLRRQVSKERGACAKVNKGAAAVRESSRPAAVSTGKSRMAKDAIGRAADEMYFTAEVHTTAQAEAALAFGPQRLYAPQHVLRSLSAQNREGQTSFVRLLPDFLSDAAVEVLLKEKRKAELSSDLAAYGAVSVGIFGLAGLLCSQKIPVYGGWRLGLYNSLTASWCQEAGILWPCVSPELNLKETGDLLRTVKECEVIAYGRLPLMLMKNCVIRAGGGRCLSKQARSARESVPAHMLLRDRTGALMPLICDPESCTNQLYNAKPLYTADKLDDLYRHGVRCIRLIFTDESPALVRAVLSRYQAACDSLTGAGVAADRSQTYKALPCCDTAGSPAAPDHSLYGGEACAARTKRTAAASPDLAPDKLFGTDGFTRGHLYRGVR